MGEVYRARDTKLGRDVAIKVLAGSFATDADRLQRFEREAHAVAALNHPNIVTIHSIESIESLHILTMELVDGKALSHLIPASGLSFDRLLKIATQLADAVGAAHQRAITHRDIKPSNVMVTEDGRVKVLDFGLAAFQTNAATADSLVTSPALTRAGVILGTVAYMSPEQAEGRHVDARSDIFSLGVTLYEMATGKRPFEGDSGLSVMSSILRDTPRPVSEINPNLPSAFTRIVRRCLEKDPERRYHSAKDLRNDLEELEQSRRHDITRPGDLREAERRATRTSAATIGLIAAAGAGIGILLGLGLPSLWSPARPAVAQPGFSQQTWDVGTEFFPSLSPDGKWLVYAGDASGNFDIYLQGIGGQTAINLTRDSSAADRQPAFSPGGERIAFRSEREGGGIFVMGRTGEATRRVTDMGFSPSWSSDGAFIVIATEDVVAGPQSRGPNSALWVVTVETGEKRELTGGDAVQPHWSPNGHRIAYWTTRGAGRQRDIATIPARGGEGIPVTDDAAVDWNPVWSPDGRHLFFLSDRSGIMSAWRVAIDEVSGRTLGPPEPVVLPSPSTAHLTFSADGRQMAYAAISAELNVDRLDLDWSKGSFTGPPSPVTSGSRAWRSLTESPDGKWLVLAAITPNEDLFIVRSDGSGLRQLTNDIAFDRFPRWSPDGKRLAFQSNRGGAWEAWAINPDGSSLVALTEKLLAHYPIWAPDGSRLVFTDFLQEFRPGLVDARKQVAAQTVTRLPAVADARYWTVWDWSSDGRWLAGDRSGGGIVVYSFDTDAITTLSETGSWPFWFSDNRRLIFHDGSAVAILDRETKRSQVVRPATAARILGLSRDGQRLYVARSSTRADVWLATIK
jgi:Tol biopolymer transport system component